MTKLGERTKRQAAEIMHNIAKKKISARKDPMGLAASILYLSSIKTGEIITNQILQGRHSGVTEVTVRNRAKEVIDKLELNQQGSFFSDRLEIVNMVVE